MQKTVLLVPKFDLENQEEERASFVNNCKELRPEGYNSESAKDKLFKVKTFDIKKQKDRDMKM